MTRRDRHSRTIVGLPERDLAELVVELAAPLLERLGPTPADDDMRSVIALAVSFWNASVLASDRWEHPQVKELNALKKRMCGRAASREDAANFVATRSRCPSAVGSSARWCSPKSGAVGRARDTTSPCSCSDV
jgi:hypothetical protein